MKRRYASTFIVLFGMSVAACASLKEAQRKQLCDGDRAYAEGMNAARNGRDMNPALFDVCGEETRDRALRAYREGYRTGLSEQGSRGVEAHAGGSEGRECIEAYGQQKCGYDCAKAYGEIECTDIPGGNCVASYGEIKCGRDCRSEYGEIVCD